MDSVNKILAERLKEIRLNIGFTQKQVCERLNIEIGTLSGYELGRRSPNPERLSELAKVYNVSIDYLLGNVDEPNHIYKKPTLLGDGKGSSVSVVEANKYDTAIVAGHHKNVSDIIAKAEKMNLTAEQKEDLEDYKKMSPEEAQRRLNEAVNKFKSLSAADQEALIKIINSLSRP